MGIDDKAAAKGKVLGGKGKEAVGDAVGDERLEAEGRTDQAKGHGKEGVEKIKDAVKDIMGRDRH